MLRRILGRIRCRDGHELVEYAIMLPLLFSLLLGIMDLASIIFSYETIENGVREGARYGIVHPTDYAGIEAAARSLTIGLDQAALSFNISYPGSNLIQVEATYDASLSTGFIMELFGGNPTLQLHAAAMMEIE